MVGLMAFGAREAKAVSPKQEWHRETDVLIIGTGAAGLAAAVEAKRAGADVLVVEKLPFLGGNTGISTAGMTGVQSKLQQESGIESWTVEEFAEWTQMGGDNKNDPVLVEVFARRSGEALDFLRELGATFPSVTHRSASVTEKWGSGLIEVLYKATTGLGVTVMTDTEVTSLIANVSVLPKKVLGVQLKDHRGAVRNVRAAKGVILATGGFGGNPEMVLRYDPSLKGYTSTNIREASSGECMCMAMSLGADTSGINYVQVHPTVHAFGGKRTLITEGIRTAGAILVNAGGQRFVDELQRRDVVSQAILKQRGGYAFLLLGRAVTHEKNKDYIDEGLVVQGDTLEEVARKTGIDPSGLRETVDRYNSYVDAQDDGDFQRGWYRELGQRQVLTARIDQGPFFTIQVRPGIHHCCGGLRINERAQVMDALPGKVIIEHLYAAGEVAGGTHGTNRMGGSAITECIVFGRIAGMNAAGA